MVESLDAAGGGADEDDFLGGRIAGRTFQHGDFRRMRSPRSHMRPRGRLHLRDNFGLFGEQARLQVYRWLGDKIHGADFERPQRGIRAFLGQRGDHDHGHRAQRHQLLKKGDAVHARHLDVERQHIGVKLLDLLARDDWIGNGAHHLDFRIGGQHAANHVPHERGIVGDKYADWLLTHWCPLNRIAGWSLQLAPSAEMPDTGAPPLRRASRSPPSEIAA